MTTPTPKLSLSRMEKYCAKASDRPWTVDVLEEQRADGSVELCDITVHGLDRCLYSSTWDAEEGNSRADADFIADARTDFPALISWAKRARAVLWKLHGFQIDSDDTNDGVDALIERLLEECGE